MTTFNQLAEAQYLPVDQLRASLLTIAKRLPQTPKFYRPICLTGAQVYFNLELSALTLQAANIVEAYVTYYDYLNEFIIYQPGCLPLDHFKQLADSLCYIFKHTNKYPSCQNSEDLDCLPIDQLIELLHAIRPIFLVEFEQTPIIHTIDSIQANKGSLIKASK